MIAALCAAAAFGGVGGLLLAHGWRVIRRNRTTAASVARDRMLAENSVAGIFECDADWNVTYSNPALGRITGLTTQQMLGLGWLAALRPDHRAIIEAALADPAVMRTATPRGRTVCYVLPDGSERWGTTEMTAMLDAAGLVIGYVGITLDTTSQHRAREALLVSEARFAALARLSPAVIFRTDHSGNCSFVNAAWHTLTGRSPADALGTGWRAALHEEDRCRLERDLLKLATVRQVAGREYRFCRPDGSVRWTTVETAPEHDADGNPVGLVGVITDITAQKQLQLELDAARASAEFAATTDELTGLPNRRQFMTRLHGEVAACRDREAPLALAIIDIDHFKRINDTHGHPRGDEVLRTVGAVLRSTTRAGDLVGRIGGEEFAVLMPETDGEMAQAICERIRTSIAASRFDPAWGPSATITISVGIASLVEGERMSELIARTDAALYRSKNAGRNQVHCAA